MCDFAAFLISMGEDVVSVEGRVEPFDNVFYVGECPEGVASLIDKPCNHCIVPVAYWPATVPINCILCFLEPQ